MCVQEVTVAGLATISILMSCAGYAIGFWCGLVKGRRPKPQQEPRITYRN